MANDDRTKIIPRRTPESAAMLANVKRAMAITANLNRLTFNDADEVGPCSAISSARGGRQLLLIPPFYTTGEVDISIGRNVFVNQNCTFYDLGGLDIADDVMIEPNVSIITSGHPVEPSPAARLHNRKAHRDRKKRLRITDRRNDHRRSDGGQLCCCGGFRSHQNVPPILLSGGNPARVIRSIAD